ncbi:hypothetical protein BJ742DRAFT_772694 [Cladochytrium replicatum]|nr:hypothetical protein BJ742DRAFT_772694 [Cladochytrium replicatum]
MDGAEGHSDVLEWMKTSGMLSETNRRMLQKPELQHGSQRKRPCERSRMVEAKRLEIQMESDALQGASKNGHVEVLEWWWNSESDLMDDPDDEDSLSDWAWKLGPNALLEFGEEIGSYAEDEDEDANEVDEDCEPKK